jgi:hypothetical protein
MASTGVAAGLIGLMWVATAGSQSGTAADPTPTRHQDPVASAAGGDVVSLVYPSVVAVHLDRSAAAIVRAEAAKDGAANTTRAANQMETARGQMFRAWQATKYVIKTTPPPPPAGDRAGVGGAGATGPSFASPPDTSLAVFQLQHDLVTHAAGLLGSDAALNSSLTNHMQRTAARRDEAIAYIHKVAPPAPPGDGRAGASGGAIAPTFDATMPSVLPLLDDEIQALQGTLALNATLPVTVQDAIRAVIATDNQTKATINTYWPPIVGDD